MNIAHKGGAKTDGKSTMRWLLAISLLLLTIPLISMQFTDEVNWNALDFLVAAFLLGGASWMFDALWRSSKNTRRKIGSAVFVMAILALIWTNLAVGIFGDEAHLVNLGYYLIGLMGATGIVLERIRSIRMELVLYLMALTQVMVLVLGWGFFPDQTKGSELSILVINAGFIIVWLGVANLLRKV